MKVSLEWEETNYNIIIENIKANGFKMFFQIMRQELVRREEQYSAAVMSGKVVTTEGAAAKNGEPAWVCKNTSQGEINVCC